MQTVEKLPEGEHVIGSKQILKATAAKSVKRIVAAANCPDFLLERIPEGVEVLRFNGDQKDLGTKLGKPFSVAMVGYR